jgi:hypothetical protein
MIQRNNFSSTSHFFEAIKFVLIHFIEGLKNLWLKIKICEPPRLIQIWNPLAVKLINGLRIIPYSCDGKRVSIMPQTMILRAVDLLSERDYHQRGVYFHFD